MVESVDSLIETLSNHIKENMKESTNAETAELTKALAELVAARAVNN